MAYLDKFVMIIDCSLHEGSFSFWILIVYFGTIVQELLSTTGMTGY